MQNSDDFWWKQDDEALPNAVFGYIKRLENDQSYIHDNNFRNMRLYGNLEASSLRGYTAYRAEPATAVTPRVTLNVVQSMVDTVVSKITKNKPKPTFLTEGGDFSLQRKAKKLTQFIEGQFEAVQFYALATAAFKDSCIEGTGAIKIYREGLDIKAERVLVDELVVDDRDALYGKPRQMHQKKYINIDVLKAAFPDDELFIDNATNADPSIWGSNTYDKSANMLLVVESWHLPSSKNAKDGKHSICINNKTLFCEQYDKDYFPFVFWRWCTRNWGFWGQGIAEQLTGIQLEINKILRTIQVAMHLVSVPKLLLEASSNVVSAHLNNKIGGIIKYVGTKPEFGKLGSIPTELFEQLDRLYTRAYEIIGISQLSAQSMKPAGLDSGKALREFNDIETERFMEVGQRYERSFLDASKIFIDLIKEVAEESDAGYKLKVKGKNFIETVDWADVSLDDDMYLMQVFPTSALSSTPAGRLQDIQELLQAGFISKEDGMKLLDFPDLQQYYNFNNAGIEDIERSIELIIDKGEYYTPEPYQNLEVGIVKMQQAYLYYRTQNAPESRLELFRRWIEDAGMLLKKAAEVQVAPAVESAPVTPMDQQLPLAAPTAMPEALPTSEIMPVAVQ